MTENRVYIAADSGGSKTIWRMLNDQGERLAQYRTKGMGAEKVGMLPVSQIVKEVQANFGGYKQPSGIYVSLGGPNVEEVKTAISECWPDVNVIVEREACGNAVLNTAAYLQCNAVVMCGTGSVAVGNTVFGRRYAGGWGPSYGDGGSGGGMGSEALRLFLRSLDGMESVGRLGEVFQNLTDGLNISIFEERMAVKARALKMNRRELASLAPQIYELALQGDETAAHLYENAAEEVAKMAYAVSEDSSEYKVLLCGGFFANKQKFIENCQQAFAKKSSARMCYNARFSPIVAAEMAVLQGNGVEVTKELFRKLLERED